MHNWSVQQKGTKLLRHPFPNPRLKYSLTDLVGVMGRKTVLDSASFRKVCAAMQNIYSTVGPGSDCQHQTCNCAGCLIASLLLGSALQLLLINPVPDNVQGYYTNDSSCQRQLPGEQYGFGELSTWARTPVIIFSPWGWWSTETHYPERPVKSPCMVMFAVWPSKTFCTDSTLKLDPFWADGWADL